MRTELPGLGRPPALEADGAGVPTSTAVVEAVAAATNARPEDMPPLFDVVDPDALERIFNQTGTGVVAFRYCGRLVGVHADGRIVVHEDD